MPVASSSGSGRPAYWSGAEIWASSTVSLTNCSKAAGVKSEVEQTAVRPPAMTRRPREWELASISFSISPRRTETVASVWATAKASH